MAIKRRKIKTSDSCKVCNGSKHYRCPKTQRWKKCECLKESKYQSRLKEARIPIRYHRLGWNEYFSAHKVEPWQKEELKEFATSLVKGNPMDSWFLINSNKDEELAKLGYLLSLIACKGSVSSTLITVSELIDIQFERQETDLSKEILNVQFLALMIGNEPPHKWNKTVIEMVLQRRWRARKPTVLLTTKDPKRLANFYQSNIIGRAVDNWFFTHVILG